jgi:mono/diheme cytochrome c family protein
MRISGITRTTAALLIFISQAAMGAPRQNDPAAVEAGRTLGQRLCSTCHAVPSDAEFPPALIHPAPSFAAIANRPSTTRESLSKFLASRHGDISVDPPNMPDLMLTDSQKAAAIAYILSLKDRPNGRE